MVLPETLEQRRLIMCDRPVFLWVKVTAFLGLEELRTNSYGWSIPMHPTHHVSSQVTVTKGTVVVTFDPAAKGLDEATFDSLAANFNFGSFLATPIAFTDDEGNRLRPAVTTITAVKADGTALGTIDHQGILDLNGLSK